MAMMSIHYYLQSINTKQYKVTYLSTGNDMHYIIASHALIIVTFVTFVYISHLISSGIFLYSRAHQGIGFVVGNCLSL